jgi:hypothetical protein
VHEKNLQIIDNNEVQIDTPSSSNRTDSKPKINFDNEGGEPLEPKTDYITQFLNLLDIEIKKVYHLFTNRERELYVSINSRLHQRQNYENFTIKQISKELEELWKISVFALNLTKFVSVNIKALKMILNRFDKNFEKNYGRISSVCAQKMIESKNADLLYILKFKVNKILIFRLLMRCQLSLMTWYKILSLELPIKCNHMISLNPCYVGMILMKINRIEGI